MSFPSQQIQPRPGLSKIAVSETMPSFCLKFIRRIKPSFQNALATGKTRHGFSLLELLIVITIVAILITISVPILSKITEIRRTTVCISNMRTLLNGLILYAGDNNATLPLYGDDVTMPVNPWTERIEPYLSFQHDTLSLDIGVGKSILRCPSAEPSTQYSYGVNYGPFGLAPISYYIPEDAQTFPGSKKLNAVSSSTFLLADHWDDGPGAAIYHPSVWALTQDTDGDGVPDSGGGRYNHLSPRHNGKAMLAFPDGSIRSFTAREWAQAGQALWGNRDN